LIIAEPRESAVDYKFAEQIMVWTRAHIQGIEADPEIRDAGVRAISAGAYAYAEEDHKFVERNIRRVSLVSIIGSLLLCLVVYPSVPLLLLSLLPTSLGILWTTGIASYYPGEVNLISLSFWRAWATIRWCISSIARRRNGPRAAASTRPWSAPLKPPG
jgi:predicted exporter